MALLASSLLVGGASWYRFAHVSYVAPKLTVEEQAAAAAANEQVLKQFLSTSSSTSVTPAQDEPLTTTDLIGRQLIADYISLAQSGQATNASLSTLAQKYLDSVPTIANANTIQITNITVVPDAPAAFQSYASALDSIYRSYATSLLGNSIGSKFSLSPSTVSMAKGMSKIYADTATKLKALSVPESLAGDHLKIINMYLEDASAMKALTTYSSDPASSFAWLIVYKANAEQESTILSDIQRIAAQNGVNTST